MSILVLAVEKKFWQDVLSKAAELGVSIGYAGVHYKKSTQSQYFLQANNVKIIDGKMFYTLKDLNQLMKQHLKNIHAPLDRDIINYFTPLEIDFYILSDRYTYFQPSFRTRKRIFRDALRFWLTYFKEQQITGLFTTCSPHSFADYTAYHVAKYLGLPVLQLAHTVINDYVIMRNDYREEDRVPADFLSGNSIEEVQNKIDPQLLGSAFTESRILKLVTKDNNISQKVITKPGKKRFAGLRKSLPRLVDNFGDIARFKGPFAMNDINSKWIRRIVKVYDAIVRNNAQKYYESKVVPVDFNSKFIYFPMHFQPERTTTPEASIFEDNLLALAILAKALPPDWKIYVKENPRQFDRINSLKGMAHRDKTDFDDFLKLPNTYLVSQKTSSAELVKHSQIVATLTGSVGWEALLAGKPVIIFGYSWYEACRACFKVSNVEECDAAIDQALKLSPDEIKLHVMKYLVYMQSKYAVGNLGEDAYVDNMNLSYEQHVNSLAEKMQQEFS